MKNFLLIVLYTFTISCAAQQGNFTNIKEKNGKIGIGTSQPDELLTVKGKIHAQEVIVDLEGAVAPDYVFEKYYKGESLLNENYSFLPLNELEIYLKKNNHLPGVPSAKYLEEEGMQLKQFNLILLEKIEELTLYTLQQQKQIETLQLKINALENK